MNQLKKQLLCITALVGVTQFCGARATPTIVPRSQSFNAARQMIGWNNPEWGINRKPQDEYYTSMNLIFEYTRTFRPNNLARCLFGDDLICGCDGRAAIDVTGSAFLNNAQMIQNTKAVNQLGLGRFILKQPTSWLADYFGLPADFQSTISFKPVISNIILDFSFYAGLDGLLDGLYFRIHGPFVHTKWNLNANENITSPGSLGYFQGYFSSVAVPVQNLNSSFLGYANGCTPIINNDYGIGDSNPPLTPLGDITWQPLCCSRIPGDDCGGQTRNGFGELRFVLGYNAIDDIDGDYHLGFGVYCAAPTGTRVGDDDCNGNGRNLFQPIVGNGKHWELGGQVTAHHIWWRNETHDKSLGFYLEANVTHLFGASQTRCFDLCSAGANSRYMLAEKLSSNQASNPKLPKFPSMEVPFVATVDGLGLEFGNEYAPVANLTRSNVISSIAAQGDIAITLAYQSDNFQIDLGYNFWGRSCEQLRINNCCCSDLGTWALKGDQRVYGFNSFQQAIKIPVTDSQATIHTGSNERNGVLYGRDSIAKNFYADNSLQLSNSLIAPSVTIYPDMVGSDNPYMYSSEEPIFIQEDDFDTNGTRGISNKIFANLNWSWPEYNDSTCSPYIGIGAEIEFGRTEGASCTSDCGNTCNSTCPTIQSCCSNCALSQWGIWLKAGASYN